MRSVETENDVRRRFGMSIVCDLDTGCHVWTGAKSSGGYGLFCLGGRRVLAHRYAYRLAHGHMPLSGLQVRHECDNPACVNPAHLLLGTAKDNARDRELRGRGRRPASVGRRSMYTDKQREVVRAYESGESTSEIAARLGLSRQGVLAIVHRYSAHRRRPGRQRVVNAHP